MKSTKFFFFFLFVSTSFFAQEENATAKAELANKIQNPIANLISVPFQNNLDFGEDIRPTNTLNIQPVYPFNIKDKINLITRTIIPVVSSPTGLEDRVVGIGNINVSMFFTPAKASKFIWGVGPTFMFPTIEEGLGFDKFGIAPSLIGLYQNNGWTVGAIFENFFGVAGNSNVGLNFFYSQVFVVKNIKKGWYVNTAPIITANWEAPSDNQWTIPVGAGFGKLFKIGKLPLNGQVGFYKFIESSMNADYQFRAQLVLLFPK